jgi:hypothetical protein
MKTYIKIALVVVSLFAVGGILAALYLYNLQHTDTSKVKPDFVISASLLQKEFGDNEKEASAKYINKVIEVSGKISSVKPGENNITSITLETESPFSSVICTITAGTDVSKLTEGNEITIRGECSGFLMDVLLNNCSLIQTK